MKKWDNLRKMTGLLCAIFISLTSMGVGMAQNGSGEFGDTLPLYAQNQIADNLLIYAYEGEIYSYDVVTQEVSRLTNDSFNDNTPVLSPNRQFIVYQSFRTRGYDLYIIDLLNGNAIYPLTSNELLEWEPSWSPDSSQLVFVSEVAQNEAIDIFRINADGTGRLNLTNTVYGESNPAWSPISNEIAFVANPEGNDAESIFLMDSNGTNLRPLTNSSSFFGLPRWSPDGTMIAFHSDFYFYRINADGTNLVLITDKYDVGAFVWLNNSQIVYSEVDTGLVRINIDGTDRVPIDIEAVPPIDVPATPPINWNPPINAGNLMSFYLKDGFTGGLILTLSEGTTIDLNEMAAETLILEGQTIPYFVGSVVFNMNGISQTDNEAPYEFTNWTVTTGEYTLTATPYSMSDGQGIAGTPLNINFNIIDNPEK